MDDPLGGLRLTTPMFGRLASWIAGVADDCCEGRLVAVTEGGYDLRALSASLRGCIEAWDEAGRKPHAPSPGADAPRADATIEAVRPHLSKYWTFGPV